MQLKVKSINTSQQPVTLNEPTSKRPDPEVPEKKPRRKFTAKYKLRILEEIDACIDSGDIGAILRREGLYYSNISKWRQQRQGGVLTGLSPQKRGRKKQEPSPEAKRLAELEKENRKLTQELKQAKTIIEAQKKISEILGISQPDSDDEKE